MLAQLKLSALASTVPRALVRATSVLRIHSNRVTGAAGVYGASLYPLPVAALLDTRPQPCPVLSGIPAVFWTVPARQSSRIGAPSPFIPAKDNALYRPDADIPHYTRNCLILQHSSAMSVHREHGNATVRRTDQGSTVVRNTPPGGERSELRRRHLRGLDDVNQ